MIWTKVFVIIALQLAGLSMGSMMQMGFGRLNDWSDTDRKMVAGWVYLIDLMLCVGLFIYWMGW